MTYKFITEVAHDLQNEDGNPDQERIPYLEWMVQRLNRAIRDAAAIAAAKPPGVTAASGTKNLAKFHEATANHQKAVEAANAKVITLRQWITRMGGVLNRNGTLDAAASYRVVQYDHQLGQQGLTKISYRNGLLVDTDDQELDTSKMVTAFSGPGKAIYVMSQSGAIHVSSHSVGERHHSSLLAATQSWIAGAGEIEVRKGTILWISNKSGHYQPTLRHFLQVLHQLHKNTVPMWFRVTFYSGHDPEDYSSLDAFMQAKNLTDDQYDYYNLVEAYADHLNPETLAPHGWEYRPTAVKPGVYDKYTDRFIPHREARSWLKHHAFTGSAQQHSGAGR
jgi:hypothetical protein